MPRRGSRGECGSVENALHVVCRVIGERDKAGTSCIPVFCGIGVIQRPAVAVLQLFGRNVPVAFALLFEQCDPEWSDHWFLWLVVRDQSASLPM